MNRIKKLFSERKEKILSIYFTAGFPKLHSTETVAKALEAAGADIIEIGIPFSDPIADGPIIQHSSKVALENGMNVRVLLEQVREIRKDVSLPIILMGYLNPVLQFGFEKFCAEAAASGVDGLILPDLPLREYEAYRRAIESSGLTHTFLISPTTAEERIRHIDQLSDGFVYVVSSSSTTGVKSGFSVDQEIYFKTLQNLELKNPVLIGFGISSPQTFSTACRYGSGAIIGSAFINLLRESINIESDIKQFVKSIRCYDYST